MLVKAVESYLAVRRAAGFKLEVDETLLRSFARFAEKLGERFVRAQTAIDWASRTTSLSFSFFLYKNLSDGGDVVHELRGRLQVPVGVSHLGMAEVRGQSQHVLSDAVATVRTGFQRPDGERVAERMQLGSSLAGGRADNFYESPKDLSDEGIP